jgi:hypothetical protein
VRLPLVVHHEDGLELDLRAGVDLHELDLDHVPGLHPLLLASDPDHGVHAFLLRRRG